MHYFFIKNKPNNDKNIKEYKLFLVISKESLDKAIISKISQIIDAKICNHLFQNNYSYSAIFQRSGVNSPWSSKAKDIIDSCISFSSYEIERFTLYEYRNSYKKEFSTQYDRMTEILISSANSIQKKIKQKYNSRQSKFKTIPIKNLNRTNKKMGLAMSASEINYLEKVYKKIKRNPTDIELMMFSQINSEHCRHKIFNSDFYISNKKKNKTLFSMIKSTYKTKNKDVLSAYTDNSSIIKGNKINELVISHNKKYQYKRTTENYIIKAETHNHPTAISPYAGAATGSGGEIRDEGATGRGSIPKSGFCGYTLSNLNIPNNQKAWEKQSFKYPSRIKSSYEIIINAPIGAARYNNEFGRPNTFGYFRTYEHQDENSKDSAYGYHKPIMIAGGIGYIKDKYAFKKKLQNNDLIVILGGPSFRIGIGGGAASSMQSGLSTEDLDFASVQRDNAELERRCQEVINACTYLNDNPIVSIHDIGAGGLCNAVPEIVNDSKMGANISLDNVAIAESNMSSLEIWCNESQERYVLIIHENNLAKFENICKRENCPSYVIGKVTSKKSLIVTHGTQTPINLPMKYLLGKPPITPIKIKKIASQFYDDNTNYPSFKECIKNVLQLPSVSDKGFLITIADRSVTGLISRDQLIGPNQIPVSNFSITKTDINSKSGQVCTIGEKPNIASCDSESSIDMAFGEVITNISSAYVEDLGRIKLSANWMANSSNEKELHSLYSSVDRLSSLCSKCNIVIPVGKDSLSMSTKWFDKKPKEVESPLSLVLSAFSSIKDVNKYVTPQASGNSDLYLIDLGRNKNRMGGSALHQTMNISNNTPPRINSMKELIAYFNCTQELIKKNLLNAYHDRSDGGLIITLIEMAFASNMSAVVNRFDCDDYIKFIFNEELGGVFAISNKNKDEFLRIIKKHKLNDNIYHLGKLKFDNNPALTLKQLDYKETLCNLRKDWSELSYLIQSKRDNKKTAYDEYKSKIESHKNISKNIEPEINFSLKNINKRFLSLQKKPKIAIFREQGVNGHKEMANAFKLVGFDCYDINTNDVIRNPNILEDFVGLVACGGFSYGDVLGAGRGWANKIIHNENAYSSLSKFFTDKNKFSLGICNGCQMLANLRTIIPGCDHWPDFISNTSNQFEARQVLVKIAKTKSIFFRDMDKSILPVIVSHGEGKISINKKNVKKPTLSFVDNFGNLTMNYPYNPNGSAHGATGFCNNDGRINIMMPHPERLIHVNNYSWAPKTWKHSPWLKFFINAREWVN